MSSSDQRERSRAIAARCSGALGGAKRGRLRRGVVPSDAVIQERRATSPGISQGQDKPPTAGLDRFPAMRLDAIKGSKAKYALLPFHSGTIHMV